MSMLHVMLPIQYLQRADAVLVAPQRRLMMAVLQTALEDCDWKGPMDLGRVRARRDARTRLQALAYVESRDRSWPFSFENICEANGLDVDGIRRALRAGSTVPT